MLVQLQDDVINLCKRIERVSVSIAYVDTSSFKGCDVTFRSSELPCTKVSSVSCWSLFSKQQGHFTLVHETLASFLLTVHEPSVIAVANVYVTDVSSLRAIYLVAILNDSVSVDVSLDFRLNECHWLISSLTVHVSNNNQSSSARSINVRGCNVSAIKLQKLNLCSASARKESVSILNNKASTRNRVHDDVICLKVVF